MFLSHWGNVESLLEPFFQNPFFFTFWEKLEDFFVFVFLGGFFFGIKNEDFGWVLYLHWWINHICSLLNLGLIA